MASPAEFAKTSSDPSGLSRGPFEFTTGRWMTNCAVLALASLLGLSSESADAMSRADPEEKEIAVTLHNDVHRVSQVLAAKIFDRKGQEIGEMIDLVFDENTGEIAAAIVSVGTWAEVGDRLAAVPWHALANRGDSGNELLLNVEPATVAKSASLFLPNEWPEFNAEWSTEVGRQYDSASITEFGQLVRASQVINAPVVDSSSQIGSIVDLVMFDATETVVLGIVALDTPTLPRSQAPFYAVPWELIRQHQTASEGFVLNVDPARLAAAPTFLESAWPDLTSPTWNQTNTSHYETVPFWSIK